MTQDTAIKYPNIQVRLVGTSSNALAVLGRVRRALSRAGLTPQEIQAFTQEATSGDFDHLLQTCMKWVNVS